MSGIFRKLCFHLLSMEKLERRSGRISGGGGEQCSESKLRNRFETKNKIKRRLYVLLMQQTGKQLRGEP